jgi:hypothetical protein
VYHAREIATGIEIAIKKLTVVQEADLRDTIKEIEIMKQVREDNQDIYINQFTLPCSAIATILFDIMTISSRRMKFGSLWSSARKARSPIC